MVHIKLLAEIKDILEKYDAEYVEIDNLESISKIHGLFSKTNPMFEPSNSAEFYYGGIFYACVIADFYKMKKYYLMAIEKDCVEAMFHLGFYYEHVEKDSEKMKKYFLMAIEKNSVKAMNNLGYYYRYVEKDYEQMKKYYLMAIEKNLALAMSNLGNYYDDVEKDYEQMMKYYLMAIRNDCVSAMYYLGCYYNDVEKDYDTMKKYYLMAIDKGSVEAMSNFSYYYDHVEKDYESLVILHHKYKNCELVGSLKKYFANTYPVSKQIMDIVLQLKEEQIEELGISCHHPYVFFEQFISNYYNDNLEYKKMDKELIWHVMNVLLDQPLVYF